MRLIFPSFIDCCLIIAIVNRQTNKRTFVGLTILALIVSLPIDYISNRYSNVLFIETVVFILFLPFLLYILRKYSIGILWMAISLIFEITIYDMAGMIIGLLIIYFSNHQMDVFIFIFFIVTRFIMLRRLKLTDEYKMNLSKVQNEEVILKFASFLMGVIILCFIFMNYIFSINDNITINKKIITILLSVVVIFGYLYIMIQQIMKYLSSLYEEKSLKDYYKVSKDYLQLIYSKTRQMKMISHNIKDHLVMVRHFAKTDTEKLLQYLDDMADLEDDSDVVWIPQMEFISPVLQNKIEFAISQGISINLDNRIKSKVIDKWNMIDIVLIVSNLLDNAIEAVSIYKDKYKYIKFIIGEERDYIYFKSANYYNCSCNISETNLGIKTDKLDRGNGLKIIDLIVEKYSGWWNYKITEDEIIFFVALSKMKNLY